MHRFYMYGLRTRVVSVQASAQPTDHQVVRTLLPIAVEGLDLQVSHTQT